MVLAAKLRHLSARVPGVARVTDAHALALTLAVAGARGAARAGAVCAVLPKERSITFALSCFWVAFSIHALDLAFLAGARRA